MKLSYILLVTNDGDSTDIYLESAELLSNLLSDCIDGSIGRAHFFVKYNDKTQKIGFCLKYEEETNSIYLSFDISNSSDEQVAEIIAYLRGEIDKRTREDFYIICALDESSEYYCNKVYPLLNKCERNLRALTYSFITKAFGYRWCDETLDVAQQNKLKSNFKVKNKVAKKQALIESALDEFTWKEYIDYLFTKHTFSNIDSSLEIDELKNKTHQQLMDIIEQYRPVTLWEKYIMPLPKEEDFLDNLNEIREKRNNIAHNKIFTKEDYEFCKDNLGMLLELINKGQKHLESLLLDEQHLSELAKDAYSSLYGLSEMMVTLNKKIADAGIDSLSHVINKNTFESLSLFSANMQSVFKMLKENSQYMKISLDKEDA